MKGIVNIDILSKDIIRVGAEKYFSERYLIEMIERAYNNGLKEGRQIHIVDPITPQNK